jgi:hypothetical protein
MRCEVLVNNKGKVSGTLTFGGDMMGFSFGLSAF